MVQKTKEEVHQALIYYKNIVNTVREALVILDGELKVVSANDAFYRIFHVSKEETEHRPIYELGNGQWNVDGLKNFLREIIPQNEHFEDYVVDHTFPVIGHKVMLLNGRRIKHEEVGAQFILLAIEDITERKKAEEALRRERKRYFTLFNSVDEGYCIIEPLFDENKKAVDYRFVEVNGVFEQQTGMHNAQGKRMREFAPFHEEYWFEIYGRISLTGKPERFENKAKYLHRWYDVYAFRIEEREGGKVAILFKDITARKKAEEEAEQGRSILDALMEFVPVELQIIDRDSTIIRDSRFSEKMTGHPIEEVVGLSLEQRNRKMPFYRPDGVTRAGVEDLPPARVLKTGEAVMNEEWKVKTVEGRFVDVSINSGPIKDRNGRVMGAVTTWHDITEIKKAIDALRTSEATLNAFFENSPAPLAIRDEDMRYVKISTHSAREYYGKEPEQIAGRKPDEIAPAFPNVIDPYAQRVLEKGETVHADINPYVPALGRKVNFTTYFFPVPLAGGRRGVGNISIDITERKKGEDTLRRNEYELKSVVENTPDIYFRLNRQQQYIFVNPTYERLAGLMKEQFIGKTNGQLGMPRQLAQFWQSAVQEAFESGKEHTVEFVISGFFGKRYFSARVIPEFEKSGLVETVLVVARDISDKKHVEEEMASIKK